jgi:NAD(P)-dependent dehydrogenase (short-subunit alcohol dehydrogenase family)
MQYAPYNIQVNALCPGFFRTPTRPRNAENAEIMADYTPLKRIADASEIKGSVLYLASSASDFVTGTTLVVDGGVLAR